MAHAADIVVANPSSVPEIAPVASALAGMGRLERYYVPIAATPEQLLLLERRLPSPVRNLVLTELRRRPLPPGVNSTSVQQLGTLSDLVRVGVSRGGGRAGERFEVPRRHLQWFDARVSRRLRGNDHAGVLSVVGAAWRTARVAQRAGIAMFLDCPLAHHRFVDRILREEAQSNPAYALTLQLHHLPESLLRRLDEEIDLAHSLFVLSSFERATFAEAGVDETKMIDAPLGVDLDLFHPLPRSDDGVFRVLFVGQITQRKGISYLVDAFRAAGIPDSELVLVGHPVGASRPWAGLPGIRHVPPVPRSQLPALYAQADVYVLPSLADGFGLTSLEAMASGVPVILSKHTFGADVVTDGRDGYLVPIRDVGAIAERLRHLARDPDLRARMAVDARRRAEDFPWTASGRRMADAIVRLT